VVAIAHVAEHHAALNAMEERLSALRH
jgi:hypothetical protein